MTVVVLGRWHCGHIDLVWDGDISDHHGLLPYCPGPHLRVCPICNQPDCNCPCDECRDGHIPPAFGDRGTVGLPVDVSGPGAADTAPTRDHHPLERGDSVPQNTTPTSMRQPGPAERSKDAGEAS